MIEITRQLTGAAMKLETVDDVLAVQKWARTQPSLYATLASRVDGKWLIEVGGVEAHTVAHIAETDTVDRWVVFDGEQFAILTDDEYDAKGYARP